jgi:hypothetical protein
MSKVRSRSRQGTAAAVLAATALTVLLAGPAAAQAAEEGSISGEVTAHRSESPLPGIQVCAFEPNGADQGCANTDSNGKYAIGSLEEGEYWVTFSPPLSSNYLPQSYNGRSDGHFDPVDVAAAPMTGINAELLEGGIIEGAVSDAANGTPIPGAEVCLVGFHFDCDMTGAGGSYAIEGLEAGEYVVEFSATDYLTQFWNGARTETEAELVAVKAEETVLAIDAALSKPAMEEEPPPSQTQPPTLYPASSMQTSSPPRRKRCKGGYRRRKVHGRYRCVKKHRRRRAHRRRQATRVQRAHGR